MNRGCVLSSTALWTWKATCPFYPPMALRFDSTLTHAHECADTNRGIYTSNTRVQSPSLAKLASNLDDGLFSVWHWWMSSMSIWHGSGNKQVDFHARYWILVQLSQVYSHFWLVCHLFLLFVEDNCCTASTRMLRMKKSSWPVWKFGVCWTHPCPRMFSLYLVQPPQLLPRHDY